MKHLNRTHRIGVGWLHEVLGNPSTKLDIELRYTDSNRMAADIYTKGFTNAEKWLEVTQNICVFHPKALKANVARAQAGWKE